MATITRARSARGSDASQARSARGSDASQPRRRPSPQPLASGAIESDDGTATGSPKRTRSFARSPPSASQADDDEQQSSFGGFHYIPLIFALVPPLGAIIHGRAEAWTDSLMLLVISFCPFAQPSIRLTRADLYQIVRMPWEMYFAARTRRVLEAAPEDDEADEDTRVDRHRRRRDAMTELRQHELFALALCVAAPGIGAWLLYSVRGVLSEPERYINPFSIRLFVLASGIKPWLHLVSLLRSRSLFLQETVHYPHGHVQRLRERTEKVEQDMASLRRMFATKADVRLLRDGIDAPLTQLSKAVRRHERKEEYLRLTAEERFQLVDSRLEEAMRELAIQADLLDAVRDEAERARRSALNPLATLFGFLHSRRNFDARARWCASAMLSTMADACRRARPAVVHVHADQPRQPCVDLRGRPRRSVRTTTTRLC